MSEHARVGPSRLEQVSLCPGSVRETDGLPRVSSRAPAEGTLLHTVAEDCLNFGFEPWDFIGQSHSVEGHDFVLGEGDDETDPQCMVDAIDWIREQPGELFVEERVSLEPYMPGQFGTLDVGIYTPRLLTVFDWKFGFIVVPILRNKQIRAYAIGLVNKLKARGYHIPNRIQLIIEQPRPPGGPRYFQPWIITLDELMAFGDEMAAIWAAANDPNAPLHAGEKQCRFCDAKDKPGGCPAHSEFMLDLMSQKFEDLDEPDALMELPPAGVITPERRSFIVRHKNMIKGWVESLGEAALADALAERPTPGMKVVDGDLGNRAWTDVEAAEVLLLESIPESTFTKKLISPTQAAKMLEPKSRKKPGNPEVWEKLNALIDRPQGKPILVVEEDPRPAKVDVDDKFEEQAEDC